MLLSRDGLDLERRRAEDHAMRKRRYTVSDGKLVLTLEEAEEGGYIVTSPLDPELITEGESIGEAFENARDALRALAQSRTKLLRKLPISHPGI
jgi:antitoxin HicB